MVAVIDGTIPELPALRVSGQSRVGSAPLTALVALLTDLGGGRGAAPAIDVGTPASIGLQPEVVCLGR